MNNASSSIKTTNIYQTLGRVFHHIPSTLNFIKNTGLCSAIMWALFQVFEVEFSIAVVFVMIGFLRLNSK